MQYRINSRTSRRRLKVTIAGCAAAAAGLLLVSQTDAYAASATSGPLALVNHTTTSNLHSLRDLQTGQCLTGTSPGQTSHWNNVIVDINNPPSFQYFSGGNCESNTNVGDLTGYQTPWSKGSDGYMTITLDEPQPPKCSTYPNC